MIRLIAVLAALVFVPAAFADVPPLLVPPHADTLRADAPAAPLIIPGRANPGDSLRITPERAAREQYALGRQFERDQNPAAAIAAYRNALRVQPSLPDAHLRMGRLFTVVGQHQPAAREYAAELKIQPGNRDASRALALERAQLGDTTSAIAALESLARSDSTDEASWQALGFAYSTAGRVADGERALRRALELEPGDADAWRDLGAVLAALQREREARDAYEQAARLDPHDGAVWVNIGNLERRAGRREAALGAYEEAVRRDSTLALAWRGRLTVLDELARPLDAAEVSRAWLGRRPGDATLRMEAISRYDDIGRREVGFELAQEGVRLAPESGEAHLALGIALGKAGRSRASLLELRRAQALVGRPEATTRVDALIAAMRAHAPDSLRAFFTEDSVRHAAADSSRLRRSRERGR